MVEHECVFVEEQEPSGRLVLPPCLVCGTTALDALEQLRPGGLAARIEALCEQATIMYHRDGARGLRVVHVRDLRAVLGGSVRAAAQGEAGHAYVSTACHHGLHPRCRKTCKFCAEACRCTGCDHAAPVGPADAPFPPLSVRALITTRKPAAGTAPDDEGRAT